MSTTVRDSLVDDRLLLPLCEQMARLRHHNNTTWKGHFTQKQLGAVDTESDHEQSVTDLEILHVEFGSLKETIEMWWKVFQAEQPAHWRWEPLKLDDEHLKLLTGTLLYPPNSITRVRINLVAHWEPEDGRSSERVRKQAKQSNEILAHSEVMSAYGLHSELFREQDGKSHPYSEMAGTDVTVPHEKGAQALYLSWDAFDRKARLYASWVDFSVIAFAAPVVREP